MLSSLHTEDGKLLGPFTEQERTDFLNKATLEYLARHPHERISFARRMARRYWRVHVLRTIKSKGEQDGRHSTGRKERRSN